jgi:hypothetical protein
MNARWPAVAFQSIFLGANSAFLFTAVGQDSTRTGCFIASMAIITLLFIIQMVSKDPRFMYLFPVVDFEVKQGDKKIVKRVKTPAYDTLILKVMIFAAIYLFFIGATRPWVTKSWIWTLVLVAVALAFPVVWDKFCDKKNEEKISERIRAAGIDPDQVQEE